MFCLRDQGYLEMIAAVGSGGNYALAAARALKENTELSAHEIAEKALHIAASICVFMLGISDEISSTGDIERIRLVGKIVDEYNAKL